MLKLKTPNAKHWSGKKEGLLTPLLAKVASLIHGMSRSLRGGPPTNSTTTDQESGESGKGDEDWQDLGHVGEDWVGIYDGMRTRQRDYANHTFYPLPLEDGEDEEKPEGWDWIGQSRVTEKVVDPNTLSIIFNTKEDKN